MQTKIFLEDVKIYARHGVLPQETLIGTDYLLNVELHLDLWKAAASDNLQDTLSYAEVNEILHQEMAIPSKLIEHVAGRIIERLSAGFPQISYVRLKITKLRPPMRGESKGASVEFEKNLK